MNKSIELALRTWYPKDHPLHLDPLHPAMGLVGEVGEWINKHKKDKYKPGFEFSREDELDELGDIWYYLRILMYQFEIPLMKPDHLEKRLNEFMSILSIESGHILLLVEQDISEENTRMQYCSTQDRVLAFYDHLLSYLKIYKNTTLDELTVLNWEKLKDGSERGEEWKRAWQD